MRPIYRPPCLILDLDALEDNLRKIAAHARQKGVRLRVHGKLHKSVDVANLQQTIGGASGICCQKVSEAEAFARGGIDDILVTNEVRDAVKIDRLAQLPQLGARIIVCVGDPTNVPELSAAAQKHGATLECLVEIDCGAGRCGVTSVAEALDIAGAIDLAEGLMFSGVQAYQGSAQHLENYAGRKAKIDTAVEVVKLVVGLLKAEWLDCELVTGGGTGTYDLEGSSDVYTELQCGSYAFMDVAYGRVLDVDGRRLELNVWENALFILTSVMSHAKKHQAVCDAGLKVQSVDSGLPIVFGREDLKFVKCSDEHGIIEDSQSLLKVNDKLRLVPGHCDPTCNLHDWYVGVRNGKVEALWPITARGKSF